MNHGVQIDIVLCEWGDYRKAHADFFHDAYNLSSATLFLKGYLLE